ncbi:MAG: phosphate acetyltransferase [Desulfovibrio sp.]|jgi:phosphate acetyltransferase|nr:phosphate acetyltransferase [Desulfovibrio sp.]
MADKLYITATETRSGKSAVVLGMMQLLLRRLRKPALFRPIISEPLTPGQRDHDIDLVLSQFSLDIPYEATYAFTIQEATDLINRGQHAVMLDTILKKFKELQSSYDFVLCEGTDFLGKDTAFEFDLNADIAANLSSPVIMVANAAGKNTQEIISAAEINLDLLYEKNLDVVACIVNRADVPAGDRGLITSTLRGHGGGDRSLLVAYVLPEERSLGRPTVGDVQKWLNADLLYGGERLDTLVDDYLIVAMQVGNFLNYIRQGLLLVTPGDREDVVLASLSSRLSSAYPDIAGILLTGGLKLPQSVRRLIDGWTGVPVPILSVQENTLDAIRKITHIYSRIDSGDTQKINTAIGHFEACIDAKELETRIVSLHSEKITPKMFEYNLIENASSNKMRIVLPEGEEERILRAVDILARRKVADVILLGRAKEIRAKMSGLGINPTVEVLEPENSPEFEKYVQMYYELRKHKGVTLEQARDVLRDPTYYGTMMVHAGDAQGMVSGSINTTAHTIRPALEVIKTRAGASIVSSVFLMCLKDRVLVFGDCAVNPNPTATQLADIAISSAHTADVFGIEPRIAMLSYSTGISGKGEDVDVVINATRLAKERAPELLIEGPLQYDAAIDPDVARTKMPDSKVAGQATVFIFPDLNTGNNTYKAVQRAAGAVAIGPVLQGLNKPVNDLSRGCTVPDIVNTVAITAIQAQAEARAAKKQ